MPVVFVRGAMLVGVLILVMMPALISTTGRSLQVQTSAGELVWCAGVKPGDSVQLQFTHSMYGGFVREFWQVTSGNKLERTWFVTENAAAAEYYATDGSSYRTDDGYVVPTLPLVQPELVVRVNSRGSHKLTVEDQSLSMADLLGTSTQVRISITQKSCP